jgi:hypothetical protein
MMTALSQAEDKARASALGADRYLVKSQVTLEDVVNATKSVLSGSDGSPPAASPPAAPATPPQAPPASPTPDPAAPTDTASIAAVPASSLPPAAATTAPVIADPVPAASAASPTDQSQTPAIDPTLTQTEASEESTVSKQIQDFINQPPQAPPADTATPVAAASPPAAPATPPPTPITAIPTPSAPVAEPPDGVSIPGKKVIQPLNDLSSKPNFDLLLAKEAQKEVEQGATQPIVNGQPATTPKTNGFLGASSPQIGQSNPNNGSEFSDPNNISL